MIASLSTENLVVLALLIPFVGALLIRCFTPLQTCARR